MSKIMTYVMGVVIASGITGIVGAGMYEKGVADGTTYGVDLYHNYCYKNGGYIINKKSPHTIVDCSGLGVLPDEEYNKLMENNTHIPKVQPTQEKKDSWKESA